MAGLDPTGFIRKTLNEILQEIKDDQRTTISNSLSLLEDSFLGQLNGIFADKLRELWEIAEEIHNAFDPDNASAEALDNIAAITGATRLSATKSTVTITATGTPTTVLPIGRAVSVNTTLDRFLTTEGGTIAAASAWTISTAYSIGNRVTNAGNIYVATVAGTSAGSGGPTGTGTGIVDGTVTWNFVGIGTGFVDIPAESENTGPIASPSRSLTNIETPVSGWDSVINLLDALPGTNTETDEDFRVRRENLLAFGGAGTLPAIRAQVVQVDGVLDVAAYENTTLVTDPDGRPGKSFEIVADGGVNQDIAQAIYDTKPAGIASFGSVTVPIEDTEGMTHNINFNRPTDVLIYIDFDVVTEPAAYAGDTALKAAVVAAAIEAFGIGDDVIAKRVECSALDVPGVIDITDFGIDITPSPEATANIVVGPRARARFDTSRVTVIST